jgi:hypothetical protein
MIELTRLPGYDVNGNPRYVCHYVNLLTEQEKNTLSPLAPPNGISEKYARAIERSHKIGGRKYHTKAYGGGIVFTDYENVIRRAIEQIVAEAEKES